MIPVFSLSSFAAGRAARRGAEQELVELHAASVWTVAVHEHVSYCFLLFFFKVLGTDQFGKCLPGAECKFSTGSGGHSWCRPSLDACADVGQFVGLLCSWLFCALSCPWQPQEDQGGLLLPCPSASLSLRVAGGCAGRPSCGVTFAPDPFLALL